MKHVSKRRWLPAALAAYLTASYAYLYFENRLPATWETAGIIALSYLLVALSWYVDDRRRRRRDASEEQQKQL